jgi:uncharacterized protein (UPF0335 family)
MSSAIHANTEPAATRFARDHLRAFVERIERLSEEKKAIADDIRDIYTEAKSNGFDTRALRAIVRLRAMDADDRREQEAILTTYMHALGMDDDPGPSGGQNGAGDGSTNSAPRTNGGSSTTTSSAPVVTQGYRGAEANSLRCARPVDGANASEKAEATRTRPTSAAHSSLPSVPTEQQSISEAPGGDKPRQDYPGPDTGEASDGTADLDIPSFLRIGDPANNWRRPKQLDSDLHATGPP